jgi:YYY domain-containing protein
LKQTFRLDKLKETIMIWRLLSWYFLILILGWVTFPLSYRLFERLTDRGYSLSRVLGLLLWGFGFWLFGSLGILQNTPGGILTPLIMLIAVSVWAGWQKRCEIWAWVRNHWRLVLTTEVVFLICLAFMVLVRASNPDATGTEKPMELAFINAVLNSESFPPHDPWLSGYAISYYHFGYILTGMLAKFTVTSGGVAFNLMLAFVFSLSAVGAYGVLYNLLTAYGKSLQASLDSLAWALFGPVFLLFVSNLEAVLEVLHQAGVGWDMAAGTSQFWAWVNINSLRNPPSQPLTLIPQRFWWWWQASRVIQDIDLLGNVSGLSPIDEFPAFSFVLGDLHPHVLVIPFVMLLVGLALNIFFGGMGREEKINFITLPYRLDLFIVSAILLGGITFLNTWDLPVYFALLTGAYFLRQVIHKGWDWKRLFELLLFAVPLGIFSLLLYTPFFISFQSQAGGILPNLIYPTRGFDLWIMFGTLFIPLFLFFGWLWRKKANTNWAWGSAVVFILIVFLYGTSLMLGFKIAQTQLGEQLIVSQGESSYVGLISSALIHRLGFGVSLLTLVALLVASFSYLVGISINDDNRAEYFGPTPFVLWMVSLGGLMVIAPEFLYLQDHFGVRMNTVFKFYYQAWMLWSLAAGFAAVILLKKASWFLKSVVLVIIVLGLVYPVLAFPEKTNNFQPAHDYTLDASVYFTRYHPDEAAAIDWLTHSDKGVVAEAIGGQYSGYARVSSLSGQPTVLGWPGHQGQWRGGYTEVGSRESDIRTLYETSDWQTALNIIQRYDICYIYIGSLEMSAYALNPVKFEQNLQPGFDQNGVLVYVVPKMLRD